ncbi:MAG: hypothetical protein ABSG19_13715 [Candidatus Aminicenantales bacterium]
MRKPLMSKDTQRPVKPLEPEPMRRGPTARDLNPDLTPRGLTPFAYCVKHALPDEWATFQLQVAGRLASEPVNVWQACGKCGFVFQREYRASPSRACIKCNYPGYENGGFMKDITPAEVVAYLAAKAKADAGRRARAKRAELYAANVERQKSGLEPLKQAEFDAQVIGYVRPVYRPGKAFEKAPAPALQVTQALADKAAKK